MVMIFMHEYWEMHNWKRSLPCTHLCKCG